MYSTSCACNIEGLCIIECRLCVCWHCWRYVIDRYHMLDLFGFTPSTLANWSGSHRSRSFSILEALMKYLPMVEVLEQASISCDIIDGNTWQILGRTGTRALLVTLRSGTCWRAQHHKLALDHVFSLACRFYRSFDQFDPHDTVLNL